MECYPWTMNFGHERATTGRRLRGSRSGFTIVEVAVASFVMVFSLASTIVALQTGFRSLDVARGTTLASQIAQSEIERIRLLNWTQITALPSSEAIDISGLFSEVGGITQHFTVVRTVGTDGTDTRTNADQIRQITLTITWKTSDGMPHSRVFRTIYSKNGLYDYFHTIARAQ